MSAQTVARWNAIPMERTAESSAKRPRADDSDGDDDISLVSRTPSPDPQVEGMDVDRYDEYVRGPAHEVVTVETRIKPSNIGFAMLARMGWQEGQPVGLSGDGRVDPIPFTVKSDQTGLGKLSQDVEMIETTVSQRRDMESERWAKQSREQKQQLQEDAARKAALHDSISDTLRPFYCALCDKQFKNVAQYDEHTNSYAHAHKVREKDMKASLRIGADAEERKEKERKREERELRKLAKAQGVRMSKASVVQDPAPPTDTTPVVPIPVESEAKPSGWNTVGSTTAPAPARGWAVVGASGPAPVATPAFRTAGWSSLEAGTTSQPPPNTSGPAPSQGGWASIATSIPAAAPLPPSGGWSTLSAPAAVHLPQAAAAPSPLERPQQPEPEPNAAVALMNAAASSPVPRPQRPAPEPKPDRENKRAGWQNFRAGKAGRR